MRTAAPVVAPYAAVTELDRALGDPRDADNPYGFAAMARRDAAESFPRELADRVGPWLRTAFVPAGQGGDLVSLDHTLMLVRAAARRDAAVMPATMFSITAAVCVLAAGSAEQRERVVRLLREGGSVGFALSEAEHGGDLLANSCAAAPDAGQDGGYLLDGEKWLVGLGERCRALLVVARTGRRGPGAFSALLLEGSEVDKARSGLRQRPAGMRGIDFAGFRFDGLPVRSDALVGLPGRGLEIAMKAMQVVRTMSTGCSLACADTGLRLAWDFARERRVGGRRASELPYPRRELATAAALVLAADVAALTAARGVHALPAAQCLWSSVAKKTATDFADEVFARCADVLGTQGVLREGPYAAFDTARRDNAVVRYIDTSPVANIRLVAAQLARLAGAAGEPSGGSGGEEALGPVFDLGAELPEADWDRLQLSDRGGDPVLSRLPAVAAAVRHAVTEGAAAPVADAARIVARTRQLECAVNGLLHDVAWRLRAGQEAGGGPPELGDLAERLCLLHTAASCVHLWWACRDRSLLGLPPGDPGWLSPVLTAVLDRAGGRVAPLPDPEARQLMDVVTPLYEENRMFSCTAPHLA
ncbi:acyl-CoA dehydrogenase [Streptomyces sp. AC602_WCS936]|uniref:acyl-CoA dehydrogenase n=1 Tax=Streptomyces sp. AC602_WCS936 TaxID=2823685 RepID=UPI001C263610|nr:acyl-CoA dehydrogenase [Streptomyces sp. AC602_WCS936]